MSKLEEFKVAVKNNTMGKFVYENFNDLSEEERQQIVPLIIQEVFGQTGFPLKENG